MLRIESLRKKWPAFELDAGLELGEGEIGALLGPSGCGKSTLLRLIAGLIRGDSGRIELDGRDLGDLPPEKRRVGMVFQDFALFPAMSVRRNIEYGPRMGGLRRRERSEIAVSLAESFEIGGLLGRSPGSLSGGEQQRVALARTLAARPDLVLLDEPLSSLDSLLRQRLRAEIRARLRAAGVMALHVTHDVEEALAIADRIFLMDDGRITESGDPETLYSRPPTAHCARFFGRGPVIPVQELIGPHETPVARTSLGDFRCLAPSPFRSLPGGASLFFLADAVVVLGGTAREGESNTLGGIVTATSFAGRFRRISLACFAQRSAPGGPSSYPVDIEVPTSVNPGVGDGLAFRVEPADCRILPESE